MGCSIVSTCGSSKCLILLPLATLESLVLQKVAFFQAHIYINVAFYTFLCIVVSILLMLTHRIWYLMRITVWIGVISFSMTLMSTISAYILWGQYKYMLSFQTDQQGFQIDTLSTNVESVNVLSCLMRKVIEKRMQ